MKTADSVARHPSCRVLSTRQQSLMYQSLCHLSTFVRGVRRHFRFGSSVSPDCRMSYQPQNSVCGIRPLQAELSDNTLAFVCAPLNRFVLDCKR
ncbi:hypothetical protein KCP70_11410 [Salmonella enterica subsp. enterica]|nr:hypothetical protein KCP70_11410 [Salmonella enterica subsp. enterica]